MKHITLTVTGIAGLIMHNGQTKNPLNPFSKALKKLTSKRGKTDEDMVAIMEIELRAGVYWKDGFGLYLPAEMVSACFLNGAKKIKQGRAAMAFLPDAEMFKFKSPNPKNLDDFLADPGFQDSRPVQVSGKAVMRTRPRLPAGWAITLSGLLDDSLMDPEVCEEIWAIAGQQAGFGDWRPSSPKMPGPYGRFEVTNFAVE